MGGDAWIRKLLSAHANLPDEWIEGKMPACLGGKGVGLQHQGDSWQCLQWAWGLMRWPCSVGRRSEPVRRIVCHSVLGQASNTCRFSLAVTKYMRFLFSIMADLSPAKGLRSIIRWSTAVLNSVFAIAVRLRIVFSVRSTTIDRRHDFASPSVIDRSGFFSPKYSCRGSLPTDASKVRACTRQISPGGRTLTRPDASGKVGRCVLSRPLVLQGKWYPSNDRRFVIISAATIAR